MSNLLDIQKAERMSCICGIRSEINKIQMAVVEI